MATFAAAISTSCLSASSNMSLFSSHAEFRRPRCTVLLIPLKMHKTPNFFGLGETHMLHPQKKHTEFCNNGLRTSILPTLRCSSTSRKKDSDVIDLEETQSRKENMVLDSLRVQSLLTTICDTTSIEEVKLDLPGFRLYVKRDLAEKSIPSTVPNPLVQTSINVHQSNDSAATTSLAVSKPNTSSSGIQRILNTASDEGLVILQSPKVGFFRRSRTIKGKQAPPSCKERQQVKEGQVLCYVEQLGGEVPVESDVSGEVVKILREDGEPVGYGDPLIAVLPSFPGIKKLH